MRARFIAIALFAAFTSIADAAPLVWQNDWTSAFKQAKAERKGVFVDYFATWCAPCKWMDQNVFVRSEVRDQLEKFVLLRINVDAGAAAMAHGVRAFPTYVVYDCAERERFRITGSKPPDVFLPALAGIAAAMPRMIQAADLLDNKQDLDAAFLLGNTYLRMGLAEYARDAYADAQKAARRAGDPAKAQVAEIQQLFTWALEGKPARSIKGLKKLQPVDAETAALLWLMLGRVHEKANDKGSAMEAYRQVQLVATADSPIYREASTAIEKLTGE